jgi:hypothetical protein
VRRGEVSFDRGETEFGRKFDRSARRAHDRLSAQAADDASVIVGHRSAGDVQAIARSAIRLVLAGPMLVPKMPMPTATVVSVAIMAMAANRAGRVLVQLLVQERTESMSGKISRQYKQGGSARTRGAKHKAGPTKGLQSLFTLSAADCARQLSLEKLR